jgi:concanavalin A-like lectin/glucanase superfamily protein/uncharacterized protein DUF2793/putative tail protein
MKRRSRIRRHYGSLRKHQGGWVQILYWIVATIITIVLTPKPAAPKPASLEDLDLPTAEENRDLPVIFGRVRVTGLNITWHGNFGTNKIKKSSLFSSSTVGYRYFLGMMMHFCRGPVDSFTRIEAGDKQAWAGDVTSNSTIQITSENLFGGEKQEGGLWGAVEFMFGGMTQTLGDYMRGQVAAPHPGFRGVAGLVYRQGLQIIMIRKFAAGGGGYIGTNGYVKPWAVTMTRVLKGWHNDVVWYPEAALVDGGMNAIHAIYEALSNPLWGANNPTTLIDDTNFRYCADICKEENLGITMMWARSSKAEDFIQNILDHIAAALGVSNNKYVITMIRGDYDPADLPLFNNDNMVEITEFQRRSWGETVNELTVAYTDPDTGKETDITVQDLGNIAAQKVRIPEKIDRTGFRSHSVAKEVAGRELLARSTPLAKISFATNRTAYALRKYGVFRCQRSEPEYGLQTETVFRVVDVRKGNLERGQITISAVEDIYALDGVQYSEVPAPPADPDPIDLPEDGPDNSGTVTSTSTTAPPTLTNLTDGQRFLVPSGATGDWSGHAGQIAEWDEDSEEWIFIDVPDGHKLRDEESGQDVEVYGGEAVPVGNNIATTKGDLLVHNGTQLVRFGVGADGQIPYADSTQAEGLRWDDAPSGGGGGGAGSIIFSDGTVPSANTIANSSAETSFASQYNLTLAYLQAGVVLRIQARGTFSTDASAAPTLRLKVKLGSALILDTGAVTTTVAMTNRGWTIEGSMLVVVGGSSGQIEAQGLCTIATGAATASIVHLVNTAKIATSLNSSKSLSITAQWGTADADNTITLRELLVFAESVEAINFEEPVSLLHFDDTDGATTFIDATRKQWVGAGDAQIDTSQFKFGTAALYLDGTGDHVDAMPDSDLLLGAGDFSIECWVRYDTRSGNNFVFSFGAGWGLYTFSGVWAVFNGVASNVIQGGAVADDTWYHVALDREGTNLRLFVDGVQVGSTYTDTTNHTTVALRIGAQPSGSGRMTGWVDEFRVYRSSQHIATFTPPAAAYDDPAPVVSEVAMLHLDGADASTTITDEIGKTWTVNGSAAIDTAQSMFGGASLEDPNSSGYISTPSHDDFGYGTEDFTIEFWIRPSTLSSASQVIYDQRTSGTQARPTLYHNTGALRYFVSGSDRIVGSALSNGSWAHVAVCRYQGNTKLFIDGTQSGSTYTDTTNYEASRVVIGDAGDALGSGFGFVGHIDEVRITKGHARYVENFTRPATPFPDP